MVVKVLGDHLIKDQADQVASFWLNFLVLQIFEKEVANNTKDLALVFFCKPLL